MELATLVDRVLPGPGSQLDRASQAAQASVRKVVESPAGRPLAAALRGNEWLGHPLHPVVIALPVGAWCVTGWYDVRSAASGDPRDEHAADGALAIGVVGAVVAAVTGLVQYLDADGAARRQTAVHAAVNNAALGLYLGSWAMRKRGRRPLGRKLSAVGLGLVGVSGYLGGDLAYRHGVGVRPQALGVPA